MVPTSNYISIHKFLYIGSHTAHSCHTNTTAPLSLMDKSAYDTFARGVGREGGECIRGRKGREVEGKGWGLGVHCFTNTPLLNSIKPTRPMSMHMNDKYATADWLKH